MKKKSKELREKRSALFTTVKSLTDAEPRTAEQEKSLQDGIAELKKLGDEIAKCEALENGLEFLDGLGKEIEASGQRKTELEIKQKPADHAEAKIPAAAKRFHCKHLRGQDAGLRAFRMGNFFAASLYGSRKAVSFCRDNGIPLEKEERTNMIEGTNYLGGYLVPEEFETEIIDLRLQYGAFRRLSKVVPMGRETKSIPRRVSGLTAYPVGEGGTITVSSKVWDNVGLVAKKWGCLSVVSNELEEDAVVNLGDDLSGEMALAFATAEDEAGFNGDGTSAYHGMTGVLAKIKGLSATIANIAGLYVGTGNLYSELTLADFEAVVGKLPKYASGPNACWLASNVFYWTVMERLALAAGGVTQREVMDGPGRGRVMFLGYPVEIVESMPKAEANSQVCALLGDLALASKFGDRSGMTLAVSTEAYVDSQSLFEKDLMAIRATERFDIVVHDVGNANATAASRVPGPIVGLITAAS